MGLALRQSFQAARARTLRTLPPLLLALAAAPLVPPAEAASASARPGVSLSRQQSWPGGHVRVRAHGFPAHATVRISLAGRRLASRRTGRGGGISALVRVPALPPGVYLLRVRRRQSVVRRRLRVLERPTTLVAAGDIACQPGLTTTATMCRQGRTARRVRALRPDVVATLGDAQYQNGELANYRAVYDRSWGAFKAITRPVPGNHEYLERADRTTAAGHFGYFGAAAGDPGKGYYRYQAGDWTVFALNTGALEYTRDGAGSAMPDDCYPVSCAARSAQVRWLRNQLGRLPDARCTLAYWHHPRYASGLPFDNPETRHLYEALHDHGVELVLTGHTHSYERFAPMNARGRVDPRRGVRQFVVGTGGRSLFAQPDTRRMGSRYMDSSRFGVLELSLSARAYEWRFVGERGGSHDFGSGTCHGPPRSRR